MNPQERFLSAMNFEDPTEFPLMEFMGFWPETERAWRQQGLVDGNVFDHFGLIEPQYVPINFNFVPAFAEEVLEEDEHHLVVIDETGCKKRIEKDASSMPCFIEFPIKGRADFESIKERMDPKDYVNRYPENWLELTEQYAQRDYPLGVVIRGPFAFCRDFVKFEHLMMMVYDDPDLIREMMAFQVDFTIALWERALDDVTLDFAYIGEDMAYKTGPMFSPAMCTEFIAPNYHRLTDFLSSYGIENRILDSDGDIRPLLDMIVECGFTATLPLEQTAGMDVVAIRDTYPKLKLIGGVDKLAIAFGREGIDKEIGKIKQLAPSGGWIPSFDHSVPPIVSYENYRMYVEELKAAVT